ncbi:carbohydrate ABC transporter permease [Halalkalibacter sp. APA_J-10(15)]|uniref:carbohydrate ABC transporter permease n=1 Tax=Halalkalibacter sp. APA_J-10(15) TaxID=2933805 RepID=UPI001FF2A1CB|nr:sugar ABC transporter permease [Halalkalibacter sp. APA_J-10(15)]MCK0472802.1 sugar ABC transporter permease [Halalkalibacter sp. APA_J-10(15)]
MKPKLNLASDNIAGYAFISPFLLSFFLFTIIPILSSLYFSFTNYDMLATPRWIGLENYDRMFNEDMRFWQAVKVTLYFVFVSVPIRLAFALLVAIILNHITKLVGLYRSVFYLPSILGGSVAIAILWRQVFGNEGVINSILNFFHIEGVSWLGNPSTAIWALISLSAWQFGSSMLIFLAGLKNIPSTYYEAASVDGSGIFSTFFKITLPLLSPVIFFNLVMQLINGFMTFTPSYIITQGGPLDSTLLYVLYIYRRAFEFFDMGYASAMAWVLLLVVAIITAIIFKTSKYWVHYESKGD